jgi:hypothetical protein
MTDDERQTAYIEHRKHWRESWWISDAEDFCARKEVDPVTGKWLESVSRETLSTVPQ